MPFLQINFRIINIHGLCLSTEKCKCRQSITTLLKGICKIRVEGKLASECWPGPQPVHVSRSLHVSATRFLVSVSLWKKARNPGFSNRWWVSRYEGQEEVREKTTC